LPDKGPSAVTGQNQDSCGAIRAALFQHVPAAPANRKIHLVVLCRLFRSALTPSWFAQLQVLHGHFRIRLDDVLSAQ